VTLDSMQMIRYPGAMRLRAVFALAITLLWLLSGCVVLTWFQRADTTDQVDQAAATAYGGRLNSLIDAAYVNEVLEELSLEIDESAGKRAQRLRGVRGEALLDLAIVGLAIEGIDPLRADQYFQTMVNIYRLDPHDPSVDFQLARSVAEDLYAAGFEPARVERAVAMIASDPDVRNPEALWLSWAEEDPWIAARARLMALRNAMRHYATWARRGTGGGGDVLIRECTFLCTTEPIRADVQTLAREAGYFCDHDADVHTDDELASLVVADPGWEPYELMRRCGVDYHGLPVSPQSRILLHESNFLDAVVMDALTTLIERVEDDHADGARSTLAAADVVIDARARLAQTAIPQVITSNLYTRDIEMELPRSFEDPDVGSVDTRPHPPRLRMLIIASDRISLALRPHLRSHTLPDGTRRSEYAEAALGYHLPGVDVARFGRPGAINVADVHDGRVTQLAAALTELEAALSGEPWVTQEERLQQGSAVGISLLIDAGTYFSTLDPVILTLRDAAYSPIVFHTYHPVLDRLSSVPISVVDGMPEGSHLLVVREDGYLVQAYDPSQLLASHLVSRVNPHALVALYNYLDEGIASGALEADRPLAIRVDDASTDFGILVHLVSAIAYRRHCDDMTSDIALLRCPPTYVDDAPERLVQGGIVVTH